VSIVIVGMLDEREDALKIIKEKIEGRGHQAILIDISIGTGAIVPALKADVSSNEIVRLAGGTLEDIKRILVRDRTTIMAMMAEGLSKKVVDLHQTGDLKGIIAIGGLTGTFLSLRALKALPFGVPKLLISSAAAMPHHASRFAEYFGMKDITVMHTVVDTVGLNSFVRRLAINGANAICGMVEAWDAPEEKKGPSIAITEFGFVEKGAHYVRNLLEKDYDLVSFHATGIGDRAAVDLVKQGTFEAFIDLVPGGFSDYLFGGNRASAGPDRLDAALNQPIPYILAPGGFDMISCGPIERKDKDDPLWVNRKLAGRKLFVQDAWRVQARTSSEEMKIIATSVAEKLNQYKNKRLVKFLIPEKGFSSLSVEGGPLYDPAGDKTFVDALKNNLDPEIKVREVDADINAPEFARAVVEVLQESFRVLKGC